VFFFSQFAHNSIITLIHRELLLLHNSDTTTTTAAAAAAAAAATATTTTTATATAAAAAAASACIHKSLYTNIFSLTYALNPITRVCNGHRMCAVKQVKPVLLNTV
jgi:hypothetical protein